MSIRTAEFSGFVLNAQQILVAIRISVIKYIFEDEMTAVASTIEIELEPRYIPKMKRGDFIEVRIRWRGESEENNSGTFSVDDVIYKTGREVFSLGASAYDYTREKPDNLEIRYTGALLQNVVGSQQAYFELNLVQPRLGIPEAIAGFYTLTNRALGDAIAEINQAFQQRGFGIYEIVAPSRIEMLKLAARMYGYVVNLKFGNIYFQAYDVDLVRTTPVMQITPDMTLPGVEFREKTKGVYGEVFVNYAVTSGNQIVDIKPARVFDSNTQAIANTQFLPPTLEIYPRLGEAIFRGIGLIVEANADRFSAYMEIEGHPALVAGVQVRLDRFNNTRDVNPDAKKIDGNWIVVKARHRFTSRGWFTYLELWKSDNIKIEFNNDGS